MAKNRIEIWEWFKILFIALLLAFVIRTFLLNPVVVDGASMNPNLQDKDHIIVTKIGEPKRFDIIVFHVSENEDYIKRVIGLPGDSIEYKDDILYINGKPFDEPYLAKYKQEAIDGPLTNSFTLRETPVGSNVVPEGHLFVMGDNRRYSEDSRHIGAIPMDTVFGKAKLIYWPLEDIKFVE